MKRHDEALIHDGALMTYHRHDEALIHDGALMNRHDKALIHDGALMTYHLLDKKLGIRTPAFPKVCSPSSCLSKPISGGYDMGRLDGPIS